MGLRISFACDHRGFALKNHLIKIAKKEGFEVTDFGCFSEEAADYVDTGRKAAEALARNEVDYAVLICGSGIGMSMVGNKVPGVRAALVFNHWSAEMTRRHNDANALCLSADQTALSAAAELFQLFITTEFEGGRHKRRVDKIGQIEMDYSKICD